MIQQYGKQFAMVPYSPRAPRRLWRRILATILLTLTGITAGMMFRSISQPRALSTGELPVLAAVPDQPDKQDKQIRLAVVEQESSETPPPQSPSAQDETDDAPFELIPVPQSSVSADSPRFDDLDRGAQRKLMSEMASAVSMAERGAHYAARARLIACLRKVARLLDAQADVDTHSTALATGFLAMEEADDFDDQGTQYQSDVLTRSFIAGHQTSILKNSPTPSAARARTAYYRFARTKLTEAAGAQAISAELLYALGRVEAEITKKMRAGHRRRAPRELPLFEAAIAVNPNHYIAANELGVALAKIGDYRRSVIAFKHSASLRSTPEVLANLEYVSRQVGDQLTAAEARQLLAGNPVKPSAMPEVSVVSLETFNQMPMPATEYPAAVANDGQSGMRPPAATNGAHGIYPAAPRPTVTQPAPATRLRREWFW